jgi:hypothetical protein
MAYPARIDLTAYRGDTWAQTFRFKEGSTPIDLTSATVEAWACSPTGEVVELEVTKGGPGEVTIAQPAGGLTAQLWEYDIEVTVAGTVKTWVRGKLGIAPDITNAIAA